MRGQELRTESVCRTQGSLCWKTLDGTAQVEAMRKVDQGTFSGAGYLGSSGLVVLKRSGVLMSLQVELIGFIDGLSCCMK